MLSRFHLIPERYGQTDGRTDRQTDGQTDLLYQYRASVCWRAIKTSGYKYTKGFSASYVSLRSSVNIVWHHPTCSTNFNKWLEWSPDSV